jgi:hypothetical protein
MGENVLDGNVLAGPFAEIFGVEMTATAVTCRNCGAVARVAELAVYTAAPGVVVRCRACDAAMIVLLARAGIDCVDLMGARFGP